MKFLKLASIAVALSFFLNHSSAADAGTSISRGGQASQELQFFGRDALSTSDLPLTPGTLSNALVSSTPQDCAALMAEIAAQEQALADLEAQLQEVDEDLDQLIIARHECMRLDPEGCDEYLPLIKEKSLQLDQLKAQIAIKKAVLQQLYGLVGALC